MTMIENLIKEMRGHGCGSVLLELAHAVKRETESAKDEVARLNKELESRSQKLEDARSAMRDEHDCLRLATLEVERLKKEMATSCAAELDTNNKRHALEQQVKELEAELQQQRDLYATLQGKLAAKSAEGAKDMMGTSRWEEVHAEAQRHYEYARNWMSKLNASNQPQAFEALEKLIAIVHKTYGDFCTLDTAAQAFKDKATELANQRDQVQRELDSTIDQLLGATKRVRDLEELCNSRLRYMQRTTEALTTAEKDLADLRWLVRWARQGATAPVCSSVNPPPYVGGHNTTAQAEGGAK